MFEIPEMKKALVHYETTSKKMKKAMGFHSVYPDIKKAVQLRQAGYSFLAVGIDTLYLGTKCKEVLQGIRKK
jgi:2-keto-3-deoxy-L-rhamnonate aldolase RhmA